MPVSEITETSEQDAESAENLGVRLRRAREAQDLSYDVISAELRISTESLKALEECRFDALGPAVFAKGYLKQYGARLGLDVPELVAEYERTASVKGGIEIAPSRTIKLQDERQVTIWIVACIVLLLIAGILGVWWWLGRDLVSPGSAETSAASAPTGGAALAVEPTGDRAGRPVSAGATEPRFEAAPRSVTTQPEPPPAAANEPGLDADAQPRAGAAVSAVPPTEPVAAPQTAAAPTGPTLEIRFIADSWADITDEAGDQLYYGLGRAGTRATIPADRKLNLFFGYADGVSLSIDGEPLAIPASARRRGDLAQFDLEARVSQNR
jgi:cytoskeleton protein RodZ